MAIRFSTAYKGVQHVTADDVGGVQQGMFGENDYVLGVGKRMAGTLVTNNNVKIEDGEAVMQGRHFRIEPNTYENVTIENGTQNMNRKDLIVWRYTKNAQTGVENIELAVLKGTPTSGTPTLKTPTKGDIQAGALLHEMPLYVVHLKGPNIVIVEPAFRVLMNMEEMEERLNDFGWKDLINSNGSWIKYRRKNGIVTVAGNSTSIELPAYPAVKSIGSLPPDCRPAIELYGIGTLKNDKGYECQVQITESGLVNIINLQSTATKYWGFTISYPAG